MLPCILRLLLLTVISPLGSSVNHTITDIDSAKFLAGVFDVFVVAAGSSLQVQHVLNLTSLSDDSLEGPLSVVLNDRLKVASRWLLTFDDVSPSQGQLSVVPVENEAAAFTCRFSTVGISPDVAISHQKSDSNQFTCLLLLHNVRSTKDNGPSSIVLEVFDNSAPTSPLVTVSGTRRKVVVPGSLSSYLQYAPIALIVIGQIALRVYSRRKAPSQAGRPSKVPRVRSSPTAPALGAAGEATTTAQEPSDTSTDPGADNDSSNQDSKKDR